jgi:hypothetical protein
MAGPDTVVLLDEVTRRARRIVAALDLRNPMRADRSRATAANE